MDACLRCWVCFYEKKTKTLGESRGLCHRSQPPPNSPPLSPFIPSISLSFMGDYVAV